MRTSRVVAYEPSEPGQVDDPKSFSERSDAPVARLVRGADHGFADAPARWHLHATRHEPGIGRCRASCRIATRSVCDDTAACAAPGAGGPGGMLKALHTGLDACLAAWRGTRAARATHAELSRRPPLVRAGLAALARLAPAPADDDESPIFLFAAGWRSGSTLLQRIVLSDPAALIWGEPYDHCNILPQLTAMLRAFDADWPPPSYFGETGPDVRLAERWVANLYPRATAMRAAHRAFLRELFAVPARASGAQRWGFKEVRLGADAACYLRWLFPSARFCFLYRDPYACWRSYRQRGARWYHTWPDRPVFTPDEFGRLWHGLVEDFRAVGPEIGALTLAYEDLVADPACFERLEQHLSLRLDRTVLEQRITGAARRDGVSRLPVLERRRLRAAVEPLASELGYRA